MYSHKIYRGVSISARLDQIESISKEYPSDDEYYVIIVYKSGAIGRYKELDFSSCDCVYETILEAWQEYVSLYEGVI